MSNLLPEVVALLESGRREVLDMFDVPNELLPEKYHGKKGHRNLAAVDVQFDRRAANRKPGRAVSVKFDAKRNITRVSKDRMAALNAYRQQIEQGAEELTPFNPCERRQNNAEITFVGAMVKSGIITREDFE